MATETKDPINRLVFNFHPFSMDQFGKNVRKLIDDGKIRSIIANDITSSTWDGEVYITFAASATLQEIVNLIISPSRADEISIENKTLRLWWD